MGTRLNRIRAWDPLQWASCDWNTKAGLLHEPTTIYYWEFMSMIGHEVWFVRNGIKCLTSGRVPKSFTGLRMFRGRSPFCKKRTWKCFVVIHLPSFNMRKISKTTQTKVKIMVWHFQNLIPFRISLIDLTYFRGHYSSLYLMVAVCCTIWAGPQTHRNR